MNKFIKALRNRFFPRNVTNILKPFSKLRQQLEEYRQDCIEKIISNNDAIDTLKEDSAKQDEEFKSATSALDNIDKFLGGK